LILDYSVHIGNPSDIDPVRPAIERLGALTGAPSLVAADRGYWDSTIETNLAAFGVGTVVIPRTGKPSVARQAIEHADGFVTAIKWRTGCEGRISHLERDCGWRRTRLRGHNGARTGAVTACSPTTSSNSSSSNDDTTMRSSNLAPAASPREAFGRRRPNPPEDTVTASSASTDTSRPTRSRHRTYFFRGK